MVVTATHAETPTITAGTTEGMRTDPAMTRTVLLEAVYEIVEAELTCDGVRRQRGLDVIFHLVGVPNGRPSR